MLTFVQLILDLACIAVLIFYLVRGARRGMIGTLSGLLTWLASFFGAKALADAGCAGLGALLEPHLLPYVTEQVSAALAESAAGTDGLGVLALIPGVEALLEQASVAVAPAVTELVARALGWLIVFVVGFLILQVLCRLVLRLLQALARLPGLHFLDHLLGAILGALKGALILGLVLSLLTWLDLMPEQLKEGTVLFQALAGL